MYIMLSHSLYCNFYMSRGASLFVSICVSFRLSELSKIKAKSLLIIVYGTGIGRQDCGTRGCFGFISHNVWGTELLSGGLHSLGAFLLNFARSLMCEV